MNKTNKPTKAEVVKVLDWLLNELHQRSNIIEMNENSIRLFSEKDLVIFRNANAVDFVKNLQQCNFTFADESEAEVQQGLINQLALDKYYLVERIKELEAENERLQKSISDDYYQDNIRLINRNNDLEKAYNELSQETEAYRNSLAYTHDGEFNKVERKPKQSKNPCKNCDCQGICNAP